MRTRVLFVFVLPSGGVDTLNRMRVKALARRGIDAHLLYFRGGSGSANNEGLTVFYGDEPERIGQIIRDGHYTAVVVVSFFMQLELFRRAGYAGPLIFEIQGFGPQDVARSTILSAAPYLNAYADAFLYPGTPHIGAILQEGYPHKPRFSFNNPFDAKAFGHQRGARHPNPILAWIGRLEPNKNWRDFLAIAAKVAAAKPNAEIWMFSDPWLAQAGEHESMTATAEALGITGRIRHLHHVPHAEMAGMYSKIGNSGGALFMTSLAEGAPYAALEALSCRCPVVTSDSDGVRSSLIDGETALYYDHGDIEGAAAEALRYMNDRALRSRLLSNGEKHVRKNFSLELYADRFAGMLLSLGVAVC